MTTIAERIKKYQGIHVLNKETGRIETVFSKSAIKANKEWDKEFRKKKWQ